MNKEKRDALLRKAGIEPPKSADEIRQEWRDQALALPKETRQKALDLVNAGEKLGDVQKACGIDEIMVLCEIINMNIENVMFLKKETV